MKILVTAFVYLGEDAGSTHVFEIWRHLAKQHQVTILLPQASEIQVQTFNQIISPRVIRFVPGTRRWPGGGLVRRFGYVLTAAWYEFYVFGYLVGHAVDAIYVRLMYSSISPLFFRWFHRPYVVEVNGLAHLGSVVLRRNLLIRLTMSWQALIERRILRGARQVVTVTEKLSQVLSRIYGLERQSITVVPNGADPDLFQPIDSARQTVSLEPQTIYLGFAGHLAPWQGIEYVVRALALLPKDVQALVIGQGPMKQAWESLAAELGVADRCRFTGLVPYPQVPIYLNACDIMVAPFTARRNADLGISPLKLYEYMACAKPVLTTDVPGVAEVVRKYDCGLVVPAEDAQELAKGVTQLLQRRAEWAAMGQRGRQAVIDGFSWAAQAAKVERVVLAAAKRS
ncbi:MAG: glycosyltransferase family 4 protein [Candidatus Kerfeldbacteria bacterium]|nr:glycosyltransferase family 4 protein [Candidatus Kerfeldbacteria bacterium]